MIKNIYNVTEFLKKGVLTMASRCEITGKGKQFGNNVSFSMRHTKRVFRPNLQKKTFIVNGQKTTLTVATSTIRTLRKKGFLLPENAKVSSL
jgi:large subunit ribosomal protein L28